MGLAPAPRRVQGFVVAFALALISAGGCHRTSKHPLPLVINEVSPAEPTRAQRGPDGRLLVDASGKPADWVEIYNPNGKPVNLSGYTLTTDPVKPKQFRFPAQALAPGGFVVVALDKNLTAGSLHANFKLKAGGEVVYLFGSDGAVLLDRKTYRNMDADSTAGRYPDGKETYGVIYAPTPGKPNKRIGVKPPRFEELPLVSPEPSPSNPDLVPVTVTILEDMGVEITQTLVDRAIAQSCVGAISDDDLLPGQARAQEIGRRPASAEQRKDVFGVVKPVAQEAITFAGLIPREADGTILRVRVTAENEIGPAVQFACHRVGSVEPTLIANEFVASNHSLVFDEFKSDGSLKPNVTPDWIEIYNYGDQTVNVAGFALLGETTYQELQSGTPLPETSIWRFGYVGIQAIEAGQHFLILADGDKPFAEDASGQVIFRDGKPVPAHKTYARAGETERRYRSTNFKLSAGNVKHPDRGDSFYLLDSDLQPIDSARFNFADQPGGEIGADRAFGRLPDGQKGSPPMSHFAGVDIGGRILDCPTPEEPNKAECELLPRFSETVFIEPRCPGPGNRALITAFLSIDLDTAAADTQARPQFEVDLFYSLNGNPVAKPLTRGAGLEVRPPTANEIALYKPDSEAGTALFLIRAELPGQAAGTLVVLQLRARDLFLPVQKNNPNLGAWVEHKEREPADPAHPDPASQLSLRFKSGYERPPVVINEVFPHADSAGLPLVYKATPALTVPQMDYAELYNDSANPVDLSGMYLDDENYLVPLGPQGRIRKFKLPAGSVIEPHGFLCLFFPKAGQEKDVPPDAVTVIGPGLDDCRETLFLLASNEDGNCVVAETRWDIQTTGDKPVCPIAIAVGVVPDGDLGGPGGQDLDQLPGPSPCASNCGGRAPRFSMPPIHFQLSSAASPMLCADPGEIVLLQAAILIDAYAAVVHPAPVLGGPTGIREAKLLVRKGDVETERRIDLAPLANPPPPDDCWVQVRLNSQIVPPYPPVTFYRVRVVDGNGAVFLSEEFSFGAAGTKPPLAINEVMALNTKTLADEKGKFWPWIELYNGGSQPANFGGMYLTDIIREPRKWQFPRIPAAVVPPRGFLIVFADGDTTNPDDLHASLTINASGPGDLFLLDKPEEGTCLVDSFHYDFTGHAPDTSIGRIPDGTGTPVVLPLATPGGPNSGGLFIRGDAIPNGRVNVTDMVWLFQIIFERAPDPSCLDILDVNDDGLVDLKDGTYLGSFLFLNGPGIPPPYPDPGPDPTPDDLPCL